MSEKINTNGTAAVQKNKFFTVRNMAFMAVMAALICIVSPFSVPIGAVPISLATFAVYLAGGILGAKKGTVSVIVYILLGAVGLPVFSGGEGGLQKLFGVTGGFIIGYIPCVLITGLFVDLFFRERVTVENKFLNWLGRAWAVPVGMVLGTVVLYALGTVWFIIAMSSTLEAALASCVLPFIPGDILKIICATIITIALRGRLTRIMNG